VTADEILDTACDAYGVTREHLVDHDKRDQDVMDARSIAVWALIEKLEYSAYRAARTVGYTDTRSNLKQSCRRLLERVTGSARLRRQIALRWPEERAVA